MLRKAEIIFEFNLNARVSPSHHASLEVSLPCNYCQRQWRTVVLKYGQPAKCCPGSAKKLNVPHPPYPGRIINISTELGKPYNVIYQIEYEVTPFIDTKYNKSADLVPFWARTNCDLYCPNDCYIELSNPPKPGHRMPTKNNGFTQTNLVRPRTTSCKTCGYELFTETTEQPIIRWLDPETDQWGQRPARFPPEPSALESYNGPTT